MYKTKMGNRVTSPEVECVLEFSVQNKMDLTEPTMLWLLSTVLAFIDKQGAAGVILCAKRGCGL